MLSQVVSASAAIFRVDDDVRRLESLARDSQRRTRLVLIYRSSRLPRAARARALRPDGKGTATGPGRRYNLGEEHATPTGNTLNESR
jgi:hypothetical protein